MIWFFIGLVVFILILNKVSLEYGFDKLDYKMKIEKDVVEIGEEIPISSTIVNRKPISISFLKVTEKFPRAFKESENIYTIFILPYQRVKRRYKVLGEKRGQHRFQHIYLEIGDFTGFNSRFKDISIKDQRVIVLPKKIELKDVISPMGDLYGSISVKRWIIDDPLMLVGIREYNLNDPQKYIHWPSTAKYNQIMVKEFDFTTEKSIMIVLNIESSKPYWKNTQSKKIERAIEITRALIEECDKEKISYGFASNAFNKSQRFNKIYSHPQGLGPGHKMKLLKILGKMDYLIGMDFESLLAELSKSQLNYTTLVVITPNMMDSYIEPLNNLNRNISKMIAISLEEENIDKLNKNIDTFRGELK